jgi:hypothetical protein
MEKQQMHDMEQVMKEAAKRISIVLGKPVYSVYNMNIEQEDKGNFGFVVTTDNCIVEKNFLFDGDVVLGTFEPTHEEEELTAPCIYNGVGYCTHNEIEDCRMCSYYNEQHHGDGLCGVKGSPCEYPDGICDECPIFIKEVR